MGFMEAVKTVFANYANFKDRSRRSEYWYFMLFYIIVYVVLALLEAAVGLSGIVTGIFALAILIPSIAVGIRRLHDTGKTAWLMLLGLIPLLGALVLIYFFVQPSAGPNEYGEGPLKAAA